MTALQVGTSVLFPNSDNVRHHVYSFSPAKKFELPLYAGVPAEPVIFDKEGFVTLGCNIHDWMVAYVAVLTTPYFQITGKEGRALLSNLPPGQFTVEVWQPSLKGAPEKFAQQVDLAASSAKELLFTLDLKPDFRVPARPRPLDRRISLKFRFRSFRSRLLFFLVALLTLLQSATYFLVRQTNRQHALTQIDSSLRAGAQIFEKLIEQRNRQITGAAAILSRDHAFQEAFAGAEQDRATTLSALESLQGRVKADVVLMASLEKELLFDLHRPDLHGGPFPFPKLIDQAETTESTNAFVLLDDGLYAMAVTPVLAPDPIAWLCPGFRIDDDFAGEIKSYAHAEITFLSGQKFFGTTFDDGRRVELMSVLRGSAPPQEQIVDLKVGGETFLSYVVPLPVENGNASALLQRSLDQELAPYRRLERIYLTVALLGLAVSVALGIRIARGVSKPVLLLATGARAIAAGDYQHRVEVKQQDELGSLAASFNHMSAGLEERDRVRDLLGKVVSPEVAAELLRNGVALGGEEREVTVLFSDLRNFTSLSEKLSPQEMLGILNRLFQPHERDRGKARRRGGQICRRCPHGAFRCAAG